jgi:hypothetical protein
VSACLCVCTRFPENGTLFTAGNSKLIGRLGSTRGFGAVPWRFGKVVDIAVGSAFALVVTSDGECEA